MRDLPEGLPFVWDYATLRNGTVFTLDTGLGKIDLLAEAAGLGTFEEVAAGLVATEAFGRRVRTLDLENLPELESLLEAEEP